MRDDLSTEDRGMSDAIATLTAENIRFHRCTDHQIKCGVWNFYPSTGKITLDGGSRIPEKGIEAFIEKVTGTRLKDADNSSLSFRFER